MTKTNDPFASLLEDLQKEAGSKEVRHKRRSRYAKVFGTRYRCTACDKLFFYVFEKCPHCEQGTARRVKEREES